MGHEVWIRNPRERGLKVDKCILVFKVYLWKHENIKKWARDQFGNRNNMEIRAGKY